MSSPEGAVDVAEKLLAAWNARNLDGVDVLDVRNGLITRILAAFDPMVGAEQLLNRSLRPAPGTWRARFAVTVQWVLARRARTDA